MAKLDVKRSITINAPIEKVYNVVSDFNHWRPWSPWLIMEPEAKVLVAEDAKSYSWEGKLTGSGNMKVLDENPNNLIKYDLNFLKPYKSNAKVAFELSATSEGVKTTWTMNSSLPFFMFFMKKMMTSFISMDYDRGLAMLKDYVEDDIVHSTLTRKGRSQFAGLDYIGLQQTCSMDHLAEKMEADFETIGSYISENGDNIAGTPMTIYHKWDIANKKVRYTSAIPVKSTAGIPEGFISGQIPNTAVESVEHTGPYEHLGNAWSTLYTMQRSKMFKLNKSVDPFEVYVNDPSEVAANELKTIIHFPVK